MTAAFSFAIGCIAIQFAIIALVLMDSVRTAQRYAEVRRDNVRLTAMYDAVTQYRRDLHKKSGKTQLFDRCGQPHSSQANPLQKNRHLGLVERDAMLRRIWRS
jgi:hypothetical protein